MSFEIYGGRLFAAGLALAFTRLRSIRSLSPKE